MTPAQRQAAWRARRQTAGENGERRISTWVSTSAALALARLAQREGVTQRDILEKLLEQAQNRVIGQLDGDALDEYLNITR